MPHSLCGFRGDVSLMGMGLGVLSFWPQMEAWLHTSCRARTLDNMRAFVRKTNPTVSGTNPVSGISLYSKGSLIEA